MNAELLVGYAVLWVVLLKTLLSRARVIPAECRRCGQLVRAARARRPICTCDR